MPEVEVHGFTPREGTPSASDLYCPMCGADFENIVYIDSLTPELVIGDHSFEIGVYQCQICQRIVIEVVDWFRD